MNVLVAGGAYQEICHRPFWKAWFGSGGRAAAVLSRSGVQTELATYCEKEREENVLAFAGAYGIHPRLQHCEKVPIFDYLHSLAIPDVYPPIQSLKQAEPISLEASCVLRFGMIEGDAIIKADQAIFDPQSSVSPDFFTTNGSTAGRLAVILNTAEALRLTKENDVKEAIRSIAVHEKAEIVVVKQGANGLLVLSNNELRWLPAFRTNSIWPIGSGDVFTASFSYFWAVMAKGAFEASELASRFTARYCATSVIPDLREDDSLSSNQLLSCPKLLDPRPTVYLAGPFFSLSQLWQIREIRYALYSQGLEVFSPLHDVGVGAFAEIAPADLEGLSKSHVVFACLDGMDPGTLYEVGYARSKGIPVVGFVHNASEDDLTMLKGTDCRIFNDLASAVYHTVWIANA